MREASTSLEVEPDGTASIRLNQPVRVDRPSDAVVIDFRNDAVSVEIGSGLSKDRGQLGASENALLVKRAIDVVGAIFGLIVLAPIFLIAALAVVFTSPGPALFSQKRVGRKGQEFNCYKFRSMQTDAEDQLEHLSEHNETTGPVFKIRNDPRVTPVGRLLRRSSMDELPQLWNVLRGEMSLVGPRPPIPEEVSQYSMRDLQRLAVKPGITGLWQVSGRSDIDFDTWVEMDLRYIETWSLALDLKLLLLTIPAVFSGKGAY